MAQHFKIEEWEDQKWFPKVMKEIEYGVKELKNVRTNELTEPKFEWKNFGKIGEWLFLPTDEYKMAKDTVRVLGYRSTNDMPLEPDKDEEQGNLPNMKINQCSFEIHVDKDNKIQQVYLPL